MIDRMGIGLLEGIFGRVEGILGSWQVCPDWGVMGKGTCSQHVCGVELQLKFYSKSGDYIKSIYII